MMRINWIIFNIKDIFVSSLQLLRPRVKADTVLQPVHPVRQTVQAVLDIYATLLQLTYFLCYPVLPQLARSLACVHPLLQVLYPLIQISLDVGEFSLHQVFPHKIDIYFALLF